MDLDYSHVRGSMSLDRLHAIMRAQMESYGIVGQECEDTMREWLPHLRGSLSGVDFDAGQAGDVGYVELSGDLQLGVGGYEETVGGVPTDGTLREEIMLEAESCESDFDKQFYQASDDVQGYVEPYLPGSDDHIDYATCHDGKGGSYEVLSSPWLADVCDDCVLGKGSGSLSVVMVDSVDSYLVVPYTNRDSIDGYIGFTSGGELVGLASVFTGDTVQDTVYRVARRSAKGCGLLLHEGFGVSVQWLVANGFRMQRFSPLLDGRDVREATRADYSMGVDTGLAIEYADGFCYLGLIAVQDLGHAATVCGSSPEGSMIAGLVTSGVVDFDACVDRRERMLVSKFGQLHVIACATGTGMTREQVVAVLAHSSMSVAGGTDNWLEELRGLSMGKIEDDGQSFIVTKRMPERGFCSSCGFDNVLLEGHAARCKLPVGKVSPRLKLYGDVAHRRDVCAMVVSCEVDAKQLSIVVAKYVDAVSQRGYLSMVAPELCTSDRSDHLCGDLFESMYTGSFRDAYLEWLWKQLGYKRVVDTAVLDTMLMDSSEALYKAMGLNSPSAVSPRRGKAKSSSGSVSSNTTGSGGGSVDCKAAVTSVRRVVGLVIADLSVLRFCEDEVIRRGSMDGHFGQDSWFVDRYRATDLAGYRRRSRAAIRYVLKGDSAVVARAVGLRASQFLELIGELMLWLGVPYVQLLNVGSNVLNLGIGEYAVAMPVLQTWTVTDADLIPMQCMLCRKAHWLIDSTVSGSGGCAKDKLEAEFEAKYVGALREYFVCYE